MKRFVVALLLGTLAAGVTSSSPAVAQSTSKDKQFLRTLRAITDTSGVSSRILIKAAKTTCRSLSAGATAYDIIDAIPDDQIEDNQSFWAALIATGVVFYCPQHESKFG